MRSGAKAARPGVTSVRIRKVKGKKGVIKDMGNKVKNGNRHIEFRIQNFIKSG